MGKKDTVEVLLIFFYTTGAVLLMVTAYLIYLRKFRKRGQMEMLNNLVFTTSRYDTYQKKTQFMIDIPKTCEVELNILNKDEQFVKNLIKDTYQPGQHTIVFEPADFENGIYFLSLKANNVSILRRITIDNKS